MFNSDSVFQEFGIKDYKLVLYESIDSNNNILESYQEVNPENSSLISSYCYKEDESDKKMRLKFDEFDEFPENSLYYLNKATGYLKHQRDALKKLKNTSRNDCLRRRSNLAVITKANWRHIKKENAIFREAISKSLEQCRQPQSLRKNQNVNANDILFIGKKIDREVLLKKIQDENDDNSIEYLYYNRKLNGKIKYENKLKFNLKKK
jgi:hypothetical protein